METINVSFPFVSFSKCARCAVPNSQMHTRCISLTLSVSLLFYSALIFARWLHLTVTHFFFSTSSIPIVVLLFTIFFRLLPVCMRCLHVFLRVQVLLVLSLLPLADQPSMYSRLCASGVAFFERSPQNGISGILYLWINRFSLFHLCYYWRFCC